MGMRSMEATRLLPGAPGKSRHYWGAPGELGGEQRPMADPTVLELAVAEEGSFLIRHTDGGEFAGDTWHMTREDAIHQAEFEYGDRIAGWTRLADDTTDFEELVAQLQRGHLT